MLVDPALVAPVLRRVDRHDERAAEAPRQVVAGGRDEPVVAVDEVESKRSPSSTPAASMSAFMCSTQATNSPRSRGRRGSRTRWTHTPPRSSSAAIDSSPREDVHLDAVRHELLGELAHVARQAPLDEGRVLPGEDEDARAHNSGSPAPRAPARGCGGRAAPQSLAAAPRSARQRAPSARSRGYGAGQLAVDHERPVGGLQREQLAQRPRPAAAPARARAAPRRAPPGQLGDLRPRPGRRGRAARPRSSPAALGARAAGSWRSSASSSGASARPCAAASSSTASSHMGPRTTSGRAARCRARSTHEPAARRHARRRTRRATKSAACSRASAQRRVVVVGAAVVGPGLWWWIVWWW